MRKRQISNMHGGYRGSGAYLDWHTTYIPSMIQVDNKPLQPIIPPSVIQPPTNAPPSTTPPIIKPNQPIKNDNGKLIAQIVGWSATGAVALAGGYAGYKMVNQQRPQVAEREQARRDFDEAGVRNNRYFSRDVWGIMRDYTFHRPVGADPAIISEDEERPLLGGDPNYLDLSEEDRLSPSLIDVEGNGPRERFFDIDL